ncbi:DDE-type integrase/transposase/recombinase [Burkholderia sp. JPY481]
MVEPLFVQCQFQQLALGEPVFKRAPTITLDGYAASHRAVREMKTDGLLPEDTKVRSSKYLNNVIEQDHRHIKSRTNVMPGSSDSGAPRPRFSGNRVDASHSQGAVRSRKARPQAGRCARRMECGPV